jgi:hypothetical protein
MKNILLFFVTILSLSIISEGKDNVLIKSNECNSVRYYIHASPTISISMPTSRIVYQRNDKNKAIIEIRGEINETASSIEARLISRKVGEGVNTKWKRVARNVHGSFSGLITATGGWYNLEVRAKQGKFFLTTALVERVGIGEVFIVAGHSVAQGGDINIEGATDDRVSTVALHEKSDTFEKYLKTGDPQFLPKPEFVQAVTGVAQAPFAHGNYLWSKFAELLAQRGNVPVLIYNAAFGGTSLEHWAKSSQGIQFDHSFIKSAIRMPYINLLNTFKKYIPLTGLRAILADQGQNDAGQKNADTIFENYKTFIRQAREDLHDPQLAVIVNRQTPKDAPAVREAQERMIKQPYSFPGPDYDILLPEDHVDGVHLSASGEEKAAEMWAKALTPEFFKNSIPWLPSWK